MASGGGNFNPPADLLDKRDQKKYRTERELRFVSKNMDQTKLDNAARQAGEKERDKWRNVDILYPNRDETIERRSLEAAEKERARLVVDERNRLKERGELRVPQRSHFNVNLEEKSKMKLWNRLDEQQKQRSLAIDKQAVDLMDKELGPSYKLSPQMLSMNLKQSKELPKNWRTGDSKSPENWRTGRPKSPENWRKK